MRSMRTISIIIIGLAVYMVAGPLAAKVAAAAPLVAAIAG